ncbi:MAG: hypothetical protein V9G12_10325 [Microthrixaceae bacterium]
MRAGALVLISVWLVGCGSGDSKNVAAELPSSTTSRVTEATSTSLASNRGPEAGATVVPGAGGSQPASSQPGASTDGGAAPVPAARSKSFSIDSDGNVVEAPAVEGGTYSAPELDQRLAAAGDDYCSLAGLADDLLGYGDVASDAQAHLNLLNADVHRRLIPHHPELVGELEGVAGALSIGDPIDAYRSSLSQVVAVDNKIFLVSDERCGQ